MIEKTDAGERKRIVTWIALGGAALVLLLVMRPAKRSRDAAPPPSDSAAAAVAAAPGRATDALTRAEWARIESLLPNARHGLAPDGGDDASSSGSARSWDAFRAFPGNAAGDPVSAAPHPTPDLFRLEGVSLDAIGSRKHAIVNDRVVRVGDEVDGHRVVAIERGEVVLESGGRRTAISIRTEKPGKSE